MFSSGKFSSGKKKHNPIFGVGADDADGADGQGLAYSRFGPLEGLTSETGGVLLIKMRVGVHWL